MARVTDYSSSVPPKSGRSFPQTLVTGAISPRSSKRLSAHIPISTRQYLRSHPPNSRSSNSSGLRQDRGEGVLPPDTQTGGSLSAVGDRAPIFTAYAALRKTPTTKRRRNH